MARDRHEEHVTFRRSSLGIKGTFEGVLTTVESCVVSDELYNELNNKPQLQLSVSLLSTKT